MTTPHDSKDIKVNEEQISALLRAKATATPEEARRIRRNLRALGYRLSEVNKGNDPSENTSERKTRKRKGPSASDVADLIPNRRTGKSAPTPVMPEDEITALRMFLESSHSVQSRSVNTLGEEEFGYGYDLFGGMKGEQLMVKFRERWPSITPQWYCVLGEPGTVRILIIGPVPGRMQG